MSLEHEAITKEIIGAAFEVHRILGYGFLESVYQKAMQGRKTQTSLADCRWRNIHTRA